MFKKILFATDNSHHSEKVLPQLIDLAKTNDAEVIIFNAYYIPEYMRSEKSSHYIDLEKMENNLIIHGDKILEEVKAKLENENIRVTAALTNGPAGISIVNKAAEEGCDLVILGTRGMKNISNPLISSVSNFVIHNAKCSVLLVQ